METTKQNVFNNTYLVVQNKNGKNEEFTLDDLRQRLIISAQGLQQDVAIDKILDIVQKNLFNGMKFAELENVLILSAVSFIEQDHAYSLLSARLLLRHIYHTVIGYWPEQINKIDYKKSFIHGIKIGVESCKFDQRLLEFDLNYLADKIEFSRDDLFDYIGLKTIQEKYLKRKQDIIFELPQSFWMRIAMGLALLEQDKNQKAVEFYDIISQMLFMLSTPTLLHAGLEKAQLSSCYLTYIADDLIHIFKCMSDNAQMSKWSGGVANDWTALRATGALIKSIDIPSQGVIPFIKVANDTTSAINRSGSRRGAVVGYMECWHYDFEDFLDLKKNTGDERRRAHDMNTAAWVPDLFMKRILTDEFWTLFSPEETPELHELYGKAFEERYIEYEQKVLEGKIRLFKVVSARQLWRKHLTRLFETGHPWVTFKDPSNIRSPQDHVGVVHSSNLCTEITLNTSREETAVCNLGSINLGMFIDAQGIIDEAKIAQTVSTAVRMLDNVIDLNFYPTKEGQTANFRHRPIGLGLMGLQDALYKLNISFDSNEALEASDRLTEIIAYHTILASSVLAKERGVYSSYVGSKWYRGILPLDTIDLLEKERGISIQKIGKVTKDWAVVRDAIKKYGMRNSNTMAIAPTATISNISGCFPCIEPIYKNLYVKSNASGDFTIVNKYLVADLKKAGLWNQQMRELLKYFDGSIQQIPTISQNLKAKYKTAFELDPLWLVQITASRGKWIDQSQSHNVFMQGTSGKLLHDIYMLAWQLGLKTTYYLRTLAASQIEKSTLDAEKYGFTQVRSYQIQEDLKQDVLHLQEKEKLNETAGQFCRIDNPDCESCQ
ncbi:ribonucleoside-diphosphate reductase subunit alpha [Candidatus Dependentiae bacterium]|nr:ribonucleoside-diphosphate reductase subunit alpha [Candidatus Dependentiae bacterium]